MSETLLMTIAAVLLNKNDSNERTMSLKPTEKQESLLEAVVNYKLIMACLNAESESFQSFFSLPMSSYMVGR